MLFNSWAGLGRVLIVGSLAYVALILCLRISGKRTLSKLSAFDLVITVALGSTLATVLLSKDVALAEGALAFTLLIALQFSIAWIAVRSEKFERLIKSEPTLLVRRGRILPNATNRERITQNDLLAAVRASGAAKLSEVDAVILESDGTISVLHADDGAATSVAKEREEER